MPHHRSHPAANGRLASLMATALLLAPQAAAAQTACLTAVNKAGAKVAAAQGKNSSSCIRDHGKGASLPQTAQACVTGDSGGRVAKAATKVDKAFDKKCTGTPPAFGLTTPFVVKESAKSDEIRLVQAVFSEPLDAAIIDALVDKDGARCQSSVSKAYEKLAATFLKDFNACKKSGLKSGTITDAAGLTDCVGADTKTKVERAGDKVARTVTGRCADVDLPTAFPGECSGAADATAFADCVVALTRCRACSMLNTMDGLSADCETVDDGADNASCTAGALCGDGIVSPPEECDDPGVSATCDDDCTLAVCGDGTLNSFAGEDCDTAGESATCDADCTDVECPDGVLNSAAGEDCEDLNLVNGDGCDNNCTITGCGNGVITSGEACDDGNVTGGDGCSATCTCEPGSLADGCGEAQCPGRVDLVAAAGVGATCANNAECAAGACDAGLGRCVTPSVRDVGYTGHAHDADWNDGSSLRLRLSCAGAPVCGECAVRGVDPGGDNCRCSTDNRTPCSDPTALSTDCSVAASCTTDDDCRVCSQTTTMSCLVDDDCPSGEHCLTGLRLPTCLGGQCVGTCNCYDGPPTAYSSGNLPTCTVRTLAADATGTLDVDTGARAITYQISEIIYLGETTTVPCPVCGGTCTAPGASVGEPCVFDYECDVSPGDGVCGNFDAVAGDGVRDGTCVHGANEGESCDPHARNESFPAPGGGDVSIDCLPAVGKNVSGQGLRIDVQQTTGAQALAAGVPCGFSFFEPELLCPCGVCSGDSFRVCSSDAQCAEVGAGSCGRRAEGDPLPNGCGGGPCLDMGDGRGECGSVSEQYCDGVARASGEPIVQCLSNTDCNSSFCGPVDCGTCTIDKPRACFLDPVTATGAPDADEPLSAATYCMPPSLSSGINAAFGLPGPVRQLQQETATYVCAGDPGSTYTPGVGGCP